MKNNPKIAFVIGTRAELIKTAPVMLELQTQNIPYYFILTGQHSVKELCLKFGIKSPDYLMSKAPEKSSKFNTKRIKAITWNISLILRLRNLLRMLSPKYVIYHGDTMTTASVAIASSKLLNPFKKYKNVHLEAGLRSGSIREPFPEEISRIIADRFSDILLAVSERSENNLRNSSKKVFKVGNTIVDSVEIAKNLAKSQKLSPLSKDKFVLISIHRHENIKNSKRMEKIVEILSAVNIPAYFTMHDNTKNQLIKLGLYEKLAKNKNIKIISPLDYISFIYQLERCSLIICDGGSLQEESLIFHKPCIILRKHTERQEGLKSNFQLLSDFQVEPTKNKIKEFLSPNFTPNHFTNPYGKKGLSKKIVKLLR